MRKIQMVDLKGQYEQIKDQVDASMAEVMEQTAFINGPQVQSFQRELEEYLEVKHVIPCGNGTDALQIAMMGLGLKPGVEVITADFTFAATVEVIALLGLTPVLVDVDPITFNIDIEAVKNAITPKTKAIVPVHLFGQITHMEELMSLAKDHNLYVIEDNAQAIGADYTMNDGSKKKAGTIGDVGSTSFFPSKNLGAYGDGGAIFTNDDTLAHSLRGIVNHGMYERYHHDVVGVNSRLDSLQAAVLRAKLPHLDAYNARRRKTAQLYTDRLKDHAKITTPRILKAPESHVFHQYTLRVKETDRDALVHYLNSREIPCGVYYPIPLHLQKAYTDERYEKGDFKVTNQLVKEVVSLPMHTELDEQQIDYITDAVLEFVNSV